MCVSYFRINFETRSLRLHFKIRGRDQNCIAHRGNIREINEACLPVTHFPFDLYTVRNQTEDQNGEKEEDIRGKRISISSRYRSTPFRRISTERRA